MKSPVIAHLVSSLRAANSFPGREETFLKITRFLKNESNSFESLKKKFHNPLFEIFRKFEIF